MATVIRNRLGALALFAAWLAGVIYLARHHVMWRDEVSAFSLSLRSDSIFSMMGDIRGEGHPALWYVLLRCVHTLLPVPQALPVTALLVAVAAALLLVMRSPFRWWLVAMILGGRMCIFEYSVMARNYGISMLLMFLFAASYEKHRARGFLLGFILFLLANCNTHSVALAGAFLLFWLVDMLMDGSIRRPGIFRIFLANAALAIAGVALCVLTVYPPLSDVRVINRPDGITPGLLFKTLFMPGQQFRFMADIWPDFPLSLALLGSTLGLLRRPAAFIAAIAALTGFSVFFICIYLSFYRHEALWLAFLISLYWITLARGDDWPAHPAWLRFTCLAGWISFLMLVGLQIPAGIMEIYAAGHMPPLSRAEDMGELVRARPDLKDAIIMADPDFMLEALPYYLPNPTYLLRAQRFGNVVIFNRQARQTLTLDDVLADARSLHARTGKPVLILLEIRLGHDLPAVEAHEGFNWDFIVTPEQIDRFFGATEFLKRFAPVRGDESYDVYLLKQ